MPRRFGCVPLGHREVDGGEQRGGILDAAPDQQQFELPRQFIGGGALGQGHRLVPWDYHDTLATIAVQPLRLRTHPAESRLRIAIVSV